mgnify:CR=1 FL=1
MANKRFFVRSRAHSEYYYKSVDRSIEAIVDKHWTIDDVRRHPNAKAGNYRIRIGKSTTELQTIYSNLILSMQTWFLWNANLILSIQIGILGNANWVLSMQTCTYKNANLISTKRKQRRFEFHKRQTWILRMRMPLRPSGISHLEIFCFSDLSDCFAFGSKLF